MLEERGEERKNRRKRKIRRRRGGKELLIFNECFLDDVDLGRLSFFNKW